MSELVITDDGFIAVKIGDVEAVIDSYQMHNQLLDIDAKLADEMPEAAPDSAARAVAFNERVAALLQPKFGTVSHRAADKFAQSLFQAVADLGKADAAAPTPA
ncbi:hypothetical protein [Frigoriglobus tundricola]|uniref:Uncharacterized protein n=1 Tax=Frigoriglobus tundricola TaxID=2774151 RepID=A0A6M5Z6L4_9BACT|nr:hypothetical protein [Frigoriglobus tundricola]QJX01242.1 hypothetical protein FTUN_8881 [Frigoriglobus tundricola]